jgi:glycosyltransferase involved in cell wall biosynthesis
MKIVIGCPVKDRAWVIPDWLRAIQDQEVDAEVEILCVASPSSDGTEQLILDGGGKLIMMKEHHYRRTKKDIDGHIWNMEMYEFMSSIRNGLKNRAFSDFEADYFFSLDSDVILPKDGLAALLDYAQEHKGVIAPAVNMVARGAAWNVMSWVDSGRPSMAHRPIQEPQAGRADVIMAAMLIPREAKSVRWEAHRQGEDIGYCIDAARNRVKLWWVPTVRTSHFMYQY